ncbi:MAG TPA: NUDIX hydrolase [Caldilineaceae bacterium]|nr:NUDIX hydrolase [Caldilineaceae bacterium]
MPRYQAAIERAELAELEARFGPLPRRRCRLAVDHPFLTGENQMLVSDGRRAEICYIMHRGDPAAGLLLHIKTFYPAGAYRLPTGGIHQGESVLETLAREVYEETGLTLGDGPGQARLQRCLGIVAYTLNHRSAGQRFAFATYHFLLQAPADREPAPVDPDEQIGGWLWRPAAALHEIAARLASVRATEPAWGDWGRYRALSHRFVASVLTPG